MIALALATLLAFPGCEGFGCETPGGRGGRVIFVTSLADSGPGTLREAIDTPGARTVVFRLGGLLTLESPLVVREPFLTIAGQTAPGSGVLIRNKVAAPLGQAIDSFTSLVIQTHDVVVRHLAIRPGIWPENPLCTGKNKLPAPYGSCVDANDVQAIGLEAGAERIVLDHLSLAYGTDEIIGIAGAKDVTIQWTLVADGFKTFPYCGLWTRCAQYRGMGIITGNIGSTQAGYPTTRLTLHHNLFANVMARAPQAGAAISDVRANVSYNWADYALDAHNVLGSVAANLVANVFIPGPDTVGGARERGFMVHDWNLRPETLDPKATLSLHIADNVGAVPYCIRANAANSWDKVDCALYAAPPVETPPVTLEPNILAAVLAGAGASLRLDATGHLVPRRDAHDLRTVEQVRSRTGHAPSHRAPIAWPKVTKRSVYSDGDKDGMPDEWERERGLKRSVADGHLDRDGDGYTNLDEFLGGTEP